MPASSAHPPVGTSFRDAEIGDDGFSDDEAHTTVSNPPPARDDRSNQFFPSQPINRPILVRLDGVHAGEVTTLERFPASIGRHATSRIVLDDAGVSRQHAAISKIGEKYFIEDLDSKNGTYVAGNRVARSELADGALVRIGSHVDFRFTLVEERQEQLLRQLYQSSTRDALTGAYNRRYFEDRLVSELAYARRHSAELSLILIDIDHFKYINDTHGHPVGDAVLQHVATVLQNQIRVEDVFARVGGEEFTVLLRAIGLANAARLAERLRSAIANSPALVEASSIPVTISAGCASIAELDLVDGRVLFSMADARLYAAKHAGRNQVVSA